MTTNRARLRLLPSRSISPIGFARVKNGLIHQNGLLTGHWTNSFQKHVDRLSDAHVHKQIQQFPFLRYSPQSKRQWIPDFLHGLFGVGLNERNFVHHRLKMPVDTF